jgi:hypothetical protein
VGTEPERARQELCDPNGASGSPARSGSRSARAGRGSGGSEGVAEGGGAGGGGGDTSAGDAGGADAGGAAPEGPVPGHILDDILDLPPDAVDDLPQDLQDDLEGLGGAPQQDGGTPDSAATQDLLDFLFN